MTQKDVRAVVREAKKQGFEVTKAGSGHLRFKAPNGALVFATGTRTDYRGHRNFLAALRRAGFR